MGLSVRDIIGRLKRTKEIQNGYRAYDLNRLLDDNGGILPEPKKIVMGREGVFWIRTVLLAVAITIALW